MASRRPARSPRRTSRSEPIVNSVVQDILRKGADAGVFVRGLNYARDGHVRLTQKSKTHAVALVRGTSTYTVVIGIEEGVAVSCTCPHFRGDALVCKHIVATAVVACDAGFLTGDGTKIRRRVVREVVAAGDEYDDDYDDDYDDEDDDDEEDDDDDDEVDERQSRRDSPRIPAATEVHPPRRGPGRSRKNPITPTSASGFAPPPRRGPGRPRKNPITPTPASEFASPPRRRPGRPRKNQITPTPASEFAPPPRRGPGRPRKNQITPTPASEFASPPTTRTSTPTPATDDSALALTSVPMIPEWKSRLDRIARSTDDPTINTRTWPADRLMHYVVDVEKSHAFGAIALTLFGSRAGDGMMMEVKISSEMLGEIPDPIDRSIATALLGASTRPRNASTQHYAFHDRLFPDSGEGTFSLTPTVAEVLLPAMCSTGRAHVRPATRDMAAYPATFDEGTGYEAVLVIRDVHAAENTTSDEVAINAFGVRGTPALAMSNGVEHRESSRSFTFGLELLDRDGNPAPMKPQLLLPGITLIGNQFNFAQLPSGEWRRMLNESPWRIPIDEIESLLESLNSIEDRPQLRLPDSLAFDDATIDPEPMLKITDSGRMYGPGVLNGALSFDYDGRIVDAEDPRRALFDLAGRRCIARDAERERAMRIRLLELGFRNVATWHSTTGTLQIGAKKLPALVHTLIAEGWRVEAEGKIYRRPFNTSIRVESGIDWFEVHATVDYGGAVASLPQLLIALRRGNGIVLLDDGTIGMLPEEWLRRCAPFASLGEMHEGHVRLRGTQIALLDALLTSMPEITVDKRVERAREALVRFTGIEPIDPPATFVGSLRGYQREGLAWAQTLQQLGYGACLADDMGLGKTVIALALLESRRLKTKRRATKTAARNPRSNGQASATASRTSLIVVPSSLMFNWRQEAERFTPELRVVEHYGAGRAKSVEEFEPYDVVLTTYGTLRQDILLLKEFEFDYVILDEAQAIKNAASVSAKAARLLRARHRLALSGTPIENHLGELWSLFEFLNPGMLGAASAFERFVASNTGDPNDRGDDRREALRRALRPFILRRTKAQVASELPAKLEQTIECELGSLQRKSYDELRKFYRASVLGAVERNGMARSKIKVLEALLRLRQAACHPALIDERKRAAPCAKFEAMLPMIDDVIESGSKALVFSQFTKYLGLLRAELDRRGIVYEYLDGRTRDRQARVERFQNDENCSLFLISLKAGGVGLNLTAAEYVFLLDPWWNPAAEAQAIDRAHRIGQRRKVFAYRIIARDTIEERVIDLQQTKRDLASAIITEDNSIIRTLRTEDFELLLS